MTSVMKGVILLLFVALVSLSVTVHADDDVEDDIGLEDMPDGEPTEPKTEATPPRVKPIYKTPVASGNTYLISTFDTVDEFKERWVVSEAKKDDTDESIAKYDGKWAVEEPVGNALQGDKALVLKSQAKHHAVSTKLEKPFMFDGKPFIVQYEVRFQNGIDCGGAYIKLLSDDPGLDLKQFRDKSPYTIMFGPDKCGLDYKFHFIFRHRHPLKGQFEEKHAKKSSASLEHFFTDKKTHLYSLVVNPDNTFEMYIDQSIVNSGNLLEDMTPAVNPSKEIVDPNDKKPADWDDREKIADPDATKPDDWDENASETISDPAASKPVGWLDDEPELVSDPDALKPADWDDDMDGEWEAPMINNPKCTDGPGCGTWKAPTIKNPEYKGKWKAPMIANPLYKGKWSPQMIENPDYFEDKTPYKMTPIGAVGLELWSMTDNIAFDNFIITDSKIVADKWAADTWEMKIVQEGIASGKSVWQGVKDMTNERPWLWAVFIVVIVLPIVLLIAYCCIPSNKDKSDAISKKSDEPSPDDEAVNDEEEEEEVEEEVDEGAGGDNETENDSNKKKGKGDLEEEDKETNDKDSNEVRTSPRKRKPRKD